MIIFKRHSRRMELQDYIQAVITDNANNTRKGTV